MAKSTNRKQQLFAEEYSVDHNGSAAAVRAGYSRQSAKVTAARLLTKANVRSIVTARAAENAETLALTRQQVVTDLRYAIELARIKGDPIAMIKGWSELAKLCGLHENS